VAVSPANSMPSYVNPAYAAPAVAVGVAPDTTWAANHAGWGAILAGLAAALLTQFLLTLLGAGIGLASFQVTGTAVAGPTVAGLSVRAGLWWIGSGIVASFVGGLVAGRLCGSPRHSTAAWHGFVTWCVTTLVVVWLLGTALGGVLGGTFTALGSALSGAAHTAVAAASPADSNGLEAQVRRLINPNDAQTVQDNVLAYIRATLAGDQKAADDARGRAVDSLARAANISPDEATNRINQLQAQAQQAAEQAKETAEQARKVAVEGALFAFAALLLGGIAAILGGGFGTPRPSVVIE
jgi:hypothetical protein